MIINLTYLLSSASECYLKIKDCSRHLCLLVSLGLNFGVHHSGTENFMLLCVATNGKVSGYWVNT